MKLLKNYILYLVLILVLASTLRFYNLGLVPSSLNWDEVSLGYNALSILQTGRDEYSDFLPAVLRSYDDYKPALYAYFVIPFVAVYGLTEQAVRLPSALSGIIAVLLVYFLVKEILGSRTIRVLGKEVNSSVVGIFAAFFLAISPWHIQFSRIAFESNVGLTINIAVFLLFLKGLKKPILIPFSFFFAALNIHMYQSERVFSPLLIICLCSIFYKYVLKNKKLFAASVAVSLIVALPLIVSIITNSNSLMRAKGVSVFSDQKLVERSSVKLVRDDVKGTAFFKVLDNRRVEFVKAAVGGYLSHFDLNWLFITGDIARHHAPNMGLLYLFEFPLLFVGIYILIFLKIDRKYKIAFFTYFLLVPIPASITSGVPHAVRTLNFAWTFEFFIAIGLIACLIYISKLRDKAFKYTFIIFSLVFCFFAFLNIAYYINQYFVQLNYFHARDWLYGYKQAVLYAKENEEKYDKIVVENEVPFDQSYMFYLFYLNVDPSYYQSLGGTTSGGFREKHRGFYKYTFEPISKSKYQGRVLYIGKPFDMPIGTSLKKSIYYPDGAEAIRIVSNE